MQDDVGAAFQLAAGDGVAEQVVVGECHQAGVLHGAEVVFGHEDLVVLAPRVGVVEEVHEEVQALLRDREDGFGVHVVGEAGPGVQTQRDGEVSTVFTGTGTGVGIGELNVVAGAHARDVARLAQRGCEAVPRDVLGDLFGPLAGSAGQHREVGRCGHFELEDGLEVRLVEVGEHAASVGRFVLRVQVDLVVCRVEETVHALTGTRVQRFCSDGQFVASSGDGEGHAEAVEGLSRVEVLSVDADGVHRIGDDVDERCGVFRRGERHGGHGVVGGDVTVGCTGHVEADAVGVEGEQTCSFLCFFASEI